MGEPAMTPQERQLVDELFDRLAKLEDAPRDPDAERLIADGVRQAPHAPYVLVQTVLVQDEALKRANARIQELEGGGQPQEQPRGFLDNMRDTLFGHEERRGSVPTVRPGGLGSSGVWGSGQGAPPPPPPGYGPPPAGYGYAPGPSPVGSGGSFLGTAAASAAGVIGGAMLLNGIRSMMGHSYGGGSSAFDPGGSGGAPWGGGSSAANSDLARQAGIDDIGSSRSASRDDDSSRAGFFGGDQDPTDTAYDDSNDDDMDIAGDIDGGDTDPTA
jgi:uncharacterized protein